MRTKLFKFWQDDTKFVCDLDRLLLEKLKCKISEVALASLHRTIRAMAHKYLLDRYASEEIKASLVFLYAGLQQKLDLMYRAEGWPPYEKDAIVTQESDYIIKLLTHLGLALKAETFSLIKGDYKAERTKLTFDPKALVSLMKALNPRHLFNYGGQYFCSNTKETYRKSTGPGLSDFISLIQNESRAKHIVVENSGSIIVHMPTTDKEAFFYEMERDSDASFLVDTLPGSQEFAEHIRNMSEDERSLLKNGRSLLKNGRSSGGVPSGLSDVGWLLTNKLQLKRVQKKIREEERVLDNLLQKAREVVGVDRNAKLIPAIEDKVLERIRNDFGQIIADPEAPKAIKKICEMMCKTDFLM